MQTINTCDWTLVISALALAIPGLAGSIVVWIKAKAEFQKAQTEFEHSKTRQNDMINQVNQIKDNVAEVKNEQIAVKEALNSNGGNGNGNH